MGHILLVEDSSMLGRLAKTKLEKALDLPVYWAKSLKEAENLLERGASNFTLALLDYNLPDAAEGEVIDTVVNKGITSYVFTANMCDEVRKDVWTKKVADYILKDDPNCLDYIVESMKRLFENRNRLVLVVDDSSSFRNYITELLYVRQFRVVTAGDGAKGLEILKNHPEISLVITDYTMPKMDGFELCQKIREIRKNDNLAIIGFTSGDDRSIGARFIKSGADDFIEKKMFLVEEFYSRVDRCLQTIELIGEVRRSAERDFLTGLYNRRFFFESGEEYFQKMKKKSIGATCAMIDIDHFKSINDTYGHEIGDRVIHLIGNVIQEHMPDEDIVARLGGEEFCVLSNSPGRSDTVECFEKLRVKIESSLLEIEGSADAVNVTCSIGLCLTMEDTLEIMVKLADDKLYEAKKGGRNRIEF